MPLNFAHPAAVIPSKGWKNTLLRSIGQILFAVSFSLSKRAKLSGLSRKQERLSELLGRAM